jgi:hypothetical protein
MTIEGVRASLGVIERPATMGPPSAAKNDGDTSTPFTISDPSGSIANASAVMATAVNVGVRRILRKAYRMSRMMRSSRGKPWASR